MDNLTTLEKIFYDLFVNTLGAWTTLVFLPLFTGVICSFIIEGINSVTPKKIKGIALTLIVVLFVGILNLFLFPNFYPDIPFKILMFVLNITFTFGFYHTFGKKVVETVTKKYLRVLKIDTDQVTENKA